MIEAAALVHVPNYGPVGVIVYVPDRETVTEALTLAALIYASEEAKLERERAT
jgi:hypothetical protein